MNEYILLGIFFLILLGIPLTALLLFWNDGKELKETEK